LRYQALRSCHSSSLATVMVSYGGCVLRCVDLEPGAYLLAELFGLGRVLEIHVKLLARCNQAPRPGLSYSADAFTITVPMEILLLARRHATLTVVSAGNSIHSSPVQRRLSGYRSCYRNLVASEFSKLQLGLCVSPLV
jgi:hypothetical protein